MTFEAYAPPPPPEPPGKLVLVPPPEPPPPPQVSAVTENTPAGAVHPLVKVPAVVKVSVVACATWISGGKLKICGQPEKIQLAIIRKIKRNFRIFDAFLNMEDLAGNYSKPRANGGNRAVGL
ncbi:MAG: hypothetical protein HY481_00490 [Candidatus Vogelbacteria bacterium]|nr:hypothetical protein [Candidatus Vogelbacteria bacterium]